MTKRAPGMGDLASLSLSLFICEVGVVITITYSMKLRVLNWG